MTADGASAGHGLQPVSVIVFPGGFNWPIWVAQDQGYFAKAGSKWSSRRPPIRFFNLPI